MVEPLLPIILQFNSVELFVFDSGPENGATRTSGGPGREEGGCVMHTEFVNLSIRAGFMIFGERNFCL